MAESGVGGRGHRRMAKPPTILDVFCECLQLIQELPPDDRPRVITALDYVRDCSGAVLKCPTPPALELAAAYMHSQDAEVLASFPLPPKTRGVDFFVVEASGGGWLAEWSSADAGVVGQGEVFDTWDGACHDAWLTAISIGTAQP